MATKTVKKDDYTTAVLLKVSREKIKAFDLKHANLLMDIIALLSSAKMKSLLELKDFIQNSRPELLEQKDGIVGDKNQA